MAIYDPRAADTDYRQPGATRATELGADPVGMATGTLNLLIGVWLFVSQWVLDYSGADPLWLLDVFGPALALFGLIRLSGVAATRIVSVLNMGIGIWLAIAAVTIVDSSVAIGNVFLCGVAAAVLAAFGALFPAQPKA